MRERTESPPVHILNTGRDVHCLHVSIAYATVDKTRGENTESLSNKNSCPPASEKFSSPKPRQKAYAFFAALTPFLTTSLLVFLATMVLNRSKSFSDFRFSTAVLFVAHVDLLHFSTIPSLVSCLRTTPVPAPRGSFSRRNGVRVKCRYGKAWRGTPVAGPSMMAYRKFEKEPCSKKNLLLTLLWSIISAITAVLPA